MHPPPPTGTTGKAPRPVVTLGCGGGAGVAAPPESTTPATSPNPAVKANATAVAPQSQPHAMACDVEVSLEHVAPLSLRCIKVLFDSEPYTHWTPWYVSAMSNMTAPLQGRRILVTGAATGIGAAAVQVLTEAGAEIVATYHQTPPSG